MSVEEATRDQSNCEEWHRLRIGRVTGSTVKMALGQAQRKKGMSKTLKETLLGKRKVPDYLPSIRYGKENEKVALETLFEAIKGDHENLSIRPSGIYLSSRNNRLGATPDSVLICDCHGEMMVEVKCPYSARNGNVPYSDLPYIDSKTMKLKKNSTYYFQVQLQLYCSEKKNAVFCVYIPGKKPFIEVIEADQEHHKDYALIGPFLRTNGAH